MANSLLHGLNCCNCNQVMETSSAEFEAIRYQIMEIYIPFITQYPSSAGNPEIKRECKVDEWFCASCQIQQKHDRCNRCRSGINALSGYYDIEDDVGFCETCYHKHSNNNERELCQHCYLFNYKCQCFSPDCQCDF